MGVGPGPGAAWVPASLGGAEWILAPDGMLVAEALSRSGCPWLVAGVLAYPVCPVILAITTWRNPGKA